MEFLPRNTLQRHGDVCCTRPALCHTCELYQSEFFVPLIPLLSWCSAIEHFREFFSECNCDYGKLPHNAKSQRLSLLFVGVKF